MARVGIWFVVFMAFVALSAAQTLKLSVEHALKGSEDWTNRGTIELPANIFTSKRSRQNLKLEQQAFGVGEQQAIHDLAKNGGLYKIRVTTPEQPGYEYIASVKACQLIASDFTDSITLNFNNKNKMFDVDYSAETASCDDLKITNFQAHKALKPRSQVSVSLPYVAPEYKEPEKQQEEADNRSFLAKYWWIILLGGGAMFLLPTQ
eukprot:TRINITY_DN5844_c0_g1_i1.p1 TRINITY_DN5844_c0_g1~~TRINITY_DN5844_c0_g1_i1.p1  ORF type:complete len:231 (-),score=76.40 TRINITY_DN5844_c0_g1_i1:67-684(-)